MNIIRVCIVTFLIGAGGWPKLMFAEETHKTAVNELKCKDCNLIMISLSNVSAEHMSLYGYERATTPNIDKWAQDAVIFENAFTQASWTLPVATSLFTALYPYTHGIRNRYIDNMLADDIKTLPEILSAQGYKTAAFTGGLDYGKKFGHMRGFEEVKVAAGGGGNPAHHNSFAEIFRWSKSWLNNNAHQKFFLFIHGYDTHCPFTPPEQFRGIFSKRDQRNTDFDDSLCFRGYSSSDNNGEYITQYYKGRDDIGTVILNSYDVQYLEDLYDEEVLSVDELLIKFLNDVGEEILKNTIIVIYSDHGEMFAKHGRFGRAGSQRGTLYEEVLHIPLIFKFPSATRTRVNGLVQLIDVMPTLLDMLDIPFSDDIQGKDLSSLIKGGGEINPYVYAGIEHLGSRVPEFYHKQSSNESIMDKKWKLIKEVTYIDPKAEKFRGKTEVNYELYDLVNDSDELINVINLEPEVANRFKKELQQWKNGAKEFFFRRPSTYAFPQDLIEDAKKSGYW